MSFEDDDTIEQTLIVIKQCFVYKIPPRATAQGHKAADWDLQNPMWTGRCVATSIGDKCKVKLEDPNSGELFATCDVTGSSVEPVTDSSRYYVIKIEDGSGRRAFIGMGFTERSDAFDFSAALQDHAKYQKQKKESEAYIQRAATQPKTDYSLPEGAKIHVELKNKKPASSTASSSGQGSFNGGFLPPPPGSRKAPAHDSPLMSNNRPNPPSQQASFDDFFGSSLPQSQQFQQTNQFSQNQFGQFPQQNQFQPSVPQQQQQSNDFWGDFTGSSNTQSNSTTQQNANNFGWL